MPTARELLEQADALMRRDREALAGGERARPSPAPVTTAPRPLAGAAVSPRTIQREPIAPSAARTSPPVHATDSPALARPVETPVDGAPAGASMPVASDAAPGQGEPAPGPVGHEEPVGVSPRPQDDVAAAADADFPMLTDAVADVVEVEEPGVSSGGEDVPLLTEAVEPLDVVELLEPDRGEPSVWDTVVRGDTSVFGRAPDSVAAIVPPLDRLPVASPQARDPLGLDRPAPGFDAQPSLPAAEWREPPVEAAERHETATGTDESKARDAAESRAVDAPPSGTESVIGPGPELEAARWSQRPPEAQPADAAELRGRAMMPPLHGEPAERAAHGREALAGFAPLRPQPGYAPESATAWGEADWGAASGAMAEEAAVPEENAPASAAQPAEAPVATTMALALDEARIAEAVDEIRMQVLQRIDIFTDTTLRAKLGEQLQPLVERASAELVAAINQHVGDLLRTHVAEVLEQEIERWRHAQR